MMRSYACADTEALFHSRAVSRFRNIERVARRKLLRIHAIAELARLRIPPGSQLEAPKAVRKDRHNMRANDHWRIGFAWKSDGARTVEIVDYHQEFEARPRCSRRSIRVRSCWRIAFSPWASASANRSQTSMSRRDGSVS